MIGIGEINAVILEINEYFLTGKTKIGARWTADDGVTIFKCYGKNCKHTIEKNLPLIAAYAYLEGFKLGITTLQWD